MGSKRDLELLEEFDKAKIDDVTKFLASPHALAYHQYILNLLANASTIKMVGILKLLIEKEGIIIEDSKIKFTSEGGKFIQEVMDTSLSINESKFLDREYYEQSKLRMRNLIEEKKVENIKHSQYPHIEEEGAPQPKGRKKKLSGL